MIAVGDTVYLKRYPAIPFVVIKIGKSPARGETFYTVRFADRPDDTRGCLVWPDALEKYT